LPGIEPYPSWQKKYQAHYYAPDLDLKDQELAAALPEDEPLKAATVAGWEASVTFAKGGSTSLWPVTGPARWAIFHVLAIKGASLGNRRK